MKSDVEHYKNGEDFFVDEDMIREILNRPTGEGVIGPYWSYFNIGKSFNAFKDHNLKIDEFKIKQPEITDFKDYFKDTINYE